MRVKYFNSNKKIVKGYLHGSGQQKGENTITSKKLLNAISFEILACMIILIYLGLILGVKYFFQKIFHEGRRGGAMKQQEFDESTGNRMPIYL